MSERNIVPESELYPKTPNLFDQPPFNRLIAKISASFTDYSLTHPLPELVDMAARLNIELTPREMSRFFLGRTAQFINRILRDNHNPSLADIVQFDVDSRLNRTTNSAKLFKQTMGTLFSGSTKLMPLMKSTIAELHNQFGWVEFLANELRTNRTRPINQFGYYAERHVQVPNFREWQKQAFPNNPLAGFDPAELTYSERPGNLPGFGAWNQNKRPKR